MAIENISRETLVEYYSERKKIRVDYGLEKGRGEYPTVRLCEEGRIVERWDRNCFVREDIPLLKRKLEEYSKQEIGLEELQEEIGMYSAQLADERQRSSDEKLDEGFRHGRMELNREIPEELGNPFNRSIKWQF